jgi:hypothetical protein
MALTVASSVEIALALQVAPRRIAARAGTWTDNDGYRLKGGNSSGKAKAISGTVNTGGGYFGCGIWNVAGTRTGKAIDFTATDPNPSVGPNCALRRLRSQGRLPTAIKQMVPKATISSRPAAMPI